MSQKTCVLFLLGIIMMTAIADLELATAQVRKPIVVGGGYRYCEVNAVHLDTLVQEVKDGTWLIVIAKAGREEHKRKYNVRRLRVIKDYFAHRPAYNKLLVLAEGTPTKGRPRVEVYINGQIRLIFLLRKKQSLKAGNCEK